MNRVLKKTIGFCMAVSMFIGVAATNIIAYAEETNKQEEYMLRVLAENQYSDAVRLGDGYLMVKNGKFDNINSLTTFTYYDSEGNSKEIKNTVGFDEIYLNTSGDTYYVDYGVLAIGKDGKVALMDENGDLLGGKENFYPCVVYAGDGLFYSTNATENQEDKGMTSIWTLRTKDGTVVKEFKNLDHWSERIHGNGYEYINSKDNNGIYNLIAVDYKGNITEMGKNFTDFVVYEEGYVVGFSSENEKGYMHVFNADGSKAFVIDDYSNIDVAGLAEYGYGIVQKYGEYNGEYKSMQNIVDTQGNLVFDLRGYDFIKSNDENTALTMDEENNICLVDYSKEIKFDSKEFVKGFDEKYTPVTWSSYYLNSTLSLSLLDYNVENDNGVSFFFNNEGEELAGNIEGIIYEFNGTYATIYDSKNERYSISDKFGNIIGENYGRIWLENIEDGAGIIARGGHNGSNKTVLLLADGSEITEYDSVGEFINGHAVVTKEGANGQGVIDSFGNLIVGFDGYTGFTQFKDSECFIGYKGETPYLFDTLGNLLTENKDYKSIATYATNFYPFPAGKNLTEYKNEILSNNMAITIDRQDMFGLIGVNKYIPVESITLNKEELNLTKGNSESLTVKINPDTATNAKVQWKSENSEIAEVDGNGKVTAKNIGETLITVTSEDGGKSATAKVSVSFEKADWNSHWGVSYIRQAMSNGWVDTSTKFRPNDAITRAEFIKIVNKAFGYKETGEEPFKDVYPNDWFYNDIRIAVKAGYVTTANAKFRPNDPISREEVAVIVTNILNNKDTDMDKIKKFEDYKLISPWAQSSVEGAVEAGYMGVNVTKFYPISNITRAEAVTTLIRVVEV